MRIDDIREALIAAPRTKHKFVSTADPWGAQKHKEWVTECMDELGNSPAHTARDLWDTTELLRRAERTLAAAVTAAQNARTVSRRGGPQHGLPSPTSFFATERESIDARNMSRADDEQFDQIMHQARKDRESGQVRALLRGHIAERCDAVSGRVKRVNKPRKSQVVTTLVSTPDTRSISQMIRDMAETGHTSRQIGAKVRMTPPNVRRKARRENIPIPADKIRGSYEVSPERIVRSTIDALTGLQYGLDMLDPDDFAEFGPVQIESWLAALDGPVKSINSLRTELRRRRT